MTCFNPRLTLFPRRFLSIPRFLVQLFGDPFSSRFTRSFQRRSSYVNLQLLLRPRPIIAANCKILQQRYLVTPWLSSPHLQTAFLSFHGRPPPVTYRRRLFRAFDGVTIALDWLTYSDCQILLIFP
ncbi:uncharacterized protein LOC120203500 [Hibiscus syriacus]|uniref:uncharacterized protein LOC120203500 n=1 Tax=Hibiscus syriacus TaxID=106335 RepID=UPI0019246436|nr:uncharacterized protein LOC120203500 [Hibiscus syriacus]